MSSLVSHKRERSLGLAHSPSPQHSTAHSPASSSSSSESTTNEDNDDDDGDEEWTEGPTQAQRRASRTSAAQGGTARRRRAHQPSIGGSTDALRTLQLQHQHQQQQRAVRPTAQQQQHSRALPPDSHLLTPQSATFPSSSSPFVPSSAFDQQHVVSSYANSLPTPTPRSSSSSTNSTSMTRSSTLPAHLASSSRPSHLHLATSHLHGGAGAYARSTSGTTSAVQPPSLSPMTLNSPFANSGLPSSAPPQFEYPFGPPDGGGHHVAGGVPITPVSPFEGYAPQDYATSYASQLQLQFLSATSSSASPAHGQFPPAVPSSAMSYAAPIPGEPQRSRLKRSHSHRDSSAATSTPTAYPYPSFPAPATATPTSTTASTATTATPAIGSSSPPPPVIPENGAFLHRHHEPFGDPFVGPQTELEAAASMAAMAAAKTGAGAGAFVYKVYHMLLDDASQHLIAFNAKGTSFIVTNTVLFSRDVLPKYFKHSNFSSFVRQLNMYNFHKVNKTPRGASRALAESQEWEFTHPKFVRGKPHQLEEIKRKAPETASNGADPLPPSASSMTRSISLGMDPHFAPLAVQHDRLSQSARSSSLSNPSGVTANGGSNANGPLPPPADARTSVSVAAGGSHAASSHPPSSSSHHFVPSPPTLSAPAPPSTSSAYPSPSSMDASPQPSYLASTPSSASSSRFPSAASYTPSHQHPGSTLTHLSSLPPPPPQRSNSHDGTSSSASRSARSSAPASSSHHAQSSSIGGGGDIVPAPLPIPTRVQQLEQQRFELATALAGTQDGYEALYRDLVDSRRREDALVQIVEELYGVVQRNFTGQLPYQFPAHVFAPKRLEDEQPLISVTHHADPRHHPHASHHQHHPQQSHDPRSSPYASHLDPSYADSGFESYSSFETPQSTQDVFGSQQQHDLHHQQQQHQEALYHPQPHRAASSSANALSDSGYYGSPQPTHLPSSASSSSQAPQSSSSASGIALHSTLAPPPSPRSSTSSTSFSSALTTPLPASPLPGSQLVGLGLSANDEQYYERLGLVDDIEMGTQHSSLSAFAGQDGSQRREGSGEYGSGYLKREDEMGFGSEGGQGMVVV